MKVVIKRAKKCKQFQILFQLLSSITNEVDIHFKDTGIFIQGMDTGHVCLFELNLKNTWFESYEVENEIICGINLTIFHKVLSCWKEGQTITITKTKEDKLNFCFEDEKLSKCFEMGLFDFDIEMLQIPDVEYDVDVNLNSKMINSLISEMDAFGEVVEINCEEDSINFKTKQNIHETQVENKLKMEDLESYSIIEDGSITLDFSLQYLMNIVQFSRISKDVDIYISENYPLKFKYCLDNKETEESENNVCIWISPRIE